MQSNLPKAHDKALRSLTQTIGFFSNVFQAASSCSSVEEMVRRLGKDRTRFLAIYWSIIIDPRLRRKKELEPQPSYLHISLEILHPLSRIISVYKKIKAGLEKGNFNYECEYNGDLFYEYKCGSKDDQANGYVNSFFGMPIGDIHLCVDNMQDIDNITDVAETIIHEASHKFAGTNDDSNVPWENAHVVESGMPTHLK